MANTSAIRQHATQTTNHHLVAAKPRAIPKSLSLNEKRIFWRKVRRKGKEAERRQDRKSKRIRQKNKIVDSKVESNDSPEIPDWGETSDIPGFPSGVKPRGKNYCKHTL